MLEKTEEKLAVVKGVRLDFCSACREALLQEAAWAEEMVVDNL